MATKLEYYTFVKRMDDGSTRIYLNGAGARYRPESQLEGYEYVEVKDGEVSVSFNADNKFTARGARMLAEATAIAARMLSNSPLVNISGD